MVGIRIEKLVNRASSGELHPASCHPVLFDELLFDLPDVLLLRYFPKCVFRVAVPGVILGYLLQKDS